MNNLPVTKEALPPLLITGGAAAALLFFYPWISIFPGTLFLFCLYFFRNPARKIQYDQRIAYSPADGVVTNIIKVKENEFLNQEVWKVTIFLNIFNVHVNRTPIAGKVERIKYVPGKFLPAFKSHASEINERNYVMIQNESTKVLVCQITGFIARRIVCWTKVGSVLKQGERIGMIKFGSCTEVYLPLNFEIQVKKGSKVKGGLTVIGRCA